jgi:hypothetical protein
MEFQSHPRQIVHETLSHKTLHKNRAGGVAQAEDPEFKPQYQKKKRKDLASRPSSVYGCDISPFFSLLASGTPDTSCVALGWVH